VTENASTPFAQHAAGSNSRPASPPPEAQIFESASRLLAEPDPGPTPWLVEGLVVDGGIACVLGAPKVGKTWILCEFAICVVAGQAALGHFQVTRPGPVMIVLEESGRAALHRRLDKLSRGRALAPDALADLHFAANRRVRLDEERWRTGLLAAAQSIQPRAVILDPLVRVKGAADENSQKEMAPVLDFMRELRDEAGCTIVFAHHTGHQNPERMRGSSDLEGYWESKVVLRHDEKTGIGSLSAEHREAEATPTLDYLLDWHEPSETISLRPIVHGDGAATHDLVAIVQSYVEQHPGKTADEIRTGVRRKQEYVREALEAGRLAGRLFKSTGGRVDSGRDERRGGWYPSNQKAPQHELTRPDTRSTRVDSTISTQSTPPYRGSTGGSTPNQDDSNAPPEAPL